MKRPAKRKVEAKQTSCFGCGNQYKPKKTSQKYCSLGCYTKKRKKTMESENKTLETLKKLVEFIESKNLELIYAIADRHGEVSISEADFKSIFRGRSVSGVRENNFTKASTEESGIVFTSTLYSPQEVFRQETTIQI